MRLQHAALEFAIELHTVGDQNLREKGRKRLVRRRHHPIVYRGPDLRIARKWLRRNVILTRDQHQPVDFRGPIRSVRVAGNSSLVL